MSLRENIQCFHQVDEEKYLEVLREVYGAREHPLQPGSFLIGDPELPFYKPHQIEGHLSILSFNYAPLSELLLQALVENPELAPDESRVRWTAEQDLVLESTLGDLRRRYKAGKEARV